MLGSARADALSYSAVKLLSKYSNLCEKHTSTSQTDRQAERRRDDMQSDNWGLHSIARLKLINTELTIENVQCTALAKPKDVSKTDEA